MEPTLVSDLCTDVADDKIKLIACGPHYSVCFTELGFLYTWGMLDLDNPESIISLPQLLPISPCPSFTPIQHLSFTLVALKATSQRILATDATGRLYEYSEGALKCQKPKEQEEKGRTFGF